MRSRLSNAVCCPDESFEEYVVGPSEAPSMVAVLAVAVESDRPPDQLRPIYEVIDPTLLDKTLASSTTPSCIEFEYEGFTVCTDGTVVRVAPAAEMPAIPSAEPTADRVEES